MYIARPAILEDPYIGTEAPHTDVYGEGAGYQPATFTSEVRDIIPWIVLGILLLVIFSSPSKSDG